MVRLVQEWERWWIATGVLEQTIRAVKTSHRLKSLNLFPNAVSARDIVHLIHHNTSIADLKASSWEELDADELIEVPQATNESLEGLMLTEGRNSPKKVPQESTSLSRVVAFNFKCFSSS